MQSRERIRLSSSDVIVTIRRITLLVLNWHVICDQKKINMATQTQSVWQFSSHVSVKSVGDSENINQSQMIWNI